MKRYWIDKETAGRTIKLSRLPRENGSSVVLDPSQDGARKETKCERR